MHCTYYVLEFVVFDVLLYVQAALYVKLRHVLSMLSVSVLLYVRT